jgi:hypothetical protein
VQLVSSKGYDDKIPVKHRNKSENTPDSILNKNES